jgi:hypothetical protein
LGARSYATPALCRPPARAKSFPTQDSGFLGHQLLAPAVVSSSRSILRWRMSVRRSLVPPSGRDQLVGGPSRAQAATASSESPPSNRSNQTGTYGREGAAASRRSTIRGQAGTSTLVSSTATGPVDGTLTDRIARRSCPRVPTGSHPGAHRAGRASPRASSRRHRRRRFHPPRSGGGGHRQASIRLYRPDGCYSRAGRVVPKPRRCRRKRPQGAGALPERRSSTGSSARPQEAHGSARRSPTARRRRVRSRGAIDRGHVVHRRRRWERSWPKSGTDAPGDQPFAGRRGLPVTLDGRG